MYYSICLQSTPLHLIFALCNEQQIIESKSLPNHTSSATLVPHIEELLKKHHLSLSNCTYIAVNQGPGPFTTLRTILATVQGIVCATPIPLVGIDGLKGLITQYRSPHHPYTVALLNAFNNELYYAIASERSCITGYGTAKIILDLMHHTLQSNKAFIIGNGIPLIAQTLRFIGDSSQITLDTTIEHCTIQDIANLAWSAWNNKEVTRTPLTPLYLKKHAAECL